MYNALYVRTCLSKRNSRWVSYGRLKKHFWRPTNLIPRGLFFSIEDRDLIESEEKASAAAAAAAGRHGFGGKEASLCERPQTGTSTKELSFLAASYLTHSLTYVCVSAYTVCIYVYKTTSFPPVLWPLRFLSLYLYR